MLLRDIPGTKQWLHDSPVAKDPFWLADVSKVSEVQIQLFYRRSAIAGNKSAAVGAVQALQSEVIALAFSGEIASPSAGIIMHEPPDEAFFLDDLKVGLRNLPEARQFACLFACLFALEAGADPKDVEDMTWGDVREITVMPSRLADILQVAEKNKHARLPYVFWERAQDGFFTSLTGLQQSAERAFKCSWPSLVRKYREKIPVDRIKDAEGFSQMVMQLGAQKG